MSYLFGKLNANNQESLATNIRRHWFHDSLRCVFPLLCGPAPRGLAKGIRGVMEKSQHEGKGFLFRRSEYTNFPPRISSSSSAAFWPVALTMLLVLFAWAFTLVRSAPVPASADVVTVSGPGVSNHGKDNLVCFPTNLMDIAVFFFVNYLAHAASARVPAGVSTRRTIKIIIDSLCYPVLGVGYALDAIAQWTVRFKTEFPFITLPDDSLETAHRAGALITACREENWAPCPDQDRNGYLHKGVRVDSAGGKSFRVAGKHDPGQKEERKRWLRFGQPDLHFNIFGGRELPEGYGWVFIPWDVTVEPPKLNTPQIEVLVDPSPPRFGRVFTSLKLPTMPLGADYSLFQPIAAVVQAISAGITLYRTRGDQLDRYGYTAFGLTVVPYLVMSVVNFFAKYVTTRLYHVHTQRCKSK